MQRKALERYQSLAERNPDGYLPYVAISQNNFANNLSLIRRFDDVLSMAEDAVGVFRVSAKERVDIYGEYLAVALNTLSNRLNELGRTDEAITAAKESVTAMKRFTLKYEAVFTPLLARSTHWRTVCSTPID